MTASPPQEISSPRSVGSSGSDSETEDGFWAKVTKLASSPIRADQFFTKVDPKCLKERLVKDQDVSLLKDHVRRIQYLVTVLDRFKNIRTPAARPLIHTIAYEKLKYLMLRSYDPDQNIGPGKQEIPFHAPHLREPCCNMNEMRKLARINTDPTVWDKPNDEIEATFFEKPLSPTNFDPHENSIRSDLQAGQMLLLINRLRAIHNLELSELGAHSPIEIYIEVNPAKPPLPIDDALKKSASAYNKAPNRKNLQNFWQRLTPHLQALPAIHIYTNIPDIDEMSIPCCDFYLSQFISIQTFYRSTMQMCQKPCVPLGKAAKRVMEQWYLLVGETSLTDAEFSDRVKQSFPRNLQNFYNAWWGFVIEEADFPPLTLQFKKDARFSGFFSHRKDPPPFFTSALKFHQLAFIAHEMLEFIQPNVFVNSSLLAQTMIGLSSISAHLFKEDRCSIDHELITEALISAYYASTKLNISNVESDSWVHIFRNAHEQDRLKFVTACHQYFHLLANTPEIPVAYAGLVKLFTAYKHFVQSLRQSDPLPEFTREIPKLSDALIIYTIHPRETNSNPKRLQLIQNIVVPRALKEGMTDNLVANIGQLAQELHGKLEFTGFTPTSQANLKSLSSFKPELAAKLFTQPTLRILFEEIIRKINTDELSGLLDNFLLEWHHTAAEQEEFAMTKTYLPKRRLLQNIDTLQKEQIYNYCMQAATPDQIKALETVQFSPQTLPPSPLFNHGLKTPNFPQEVQNLIANAIAQGIRDLPPFDITQLAQACKHTCLTGITQPIDFCLTSSDTHRFLLAQLHNLRPLEIKAEETLLISLATQPSYQTLLAYQTNSLEPESKRNLTQKLCLLILPQSIHATLPSMPKATLNPSKPNYIKYRTQLIIQWLLLNHRNPTDLQRIYKDQLLDFLITHAVKNATQLQLTKLQKAEQEYQNTLTTEHLATTIKYQLLRTETKTRRRAIKSLKLALSNDPDKTSSSSNNKHS
ncbi:MAG: hypothetical protein KDK50_03005 [Chlamydiia bacterium]|nr:hypothetical protein [Chlamydiia bacterium]